MSSIGSPATAYTPIQRALHWLTALVVLPMIPAGVAMVMMFEGVIPGGGWQDTLFHFHRSCGIVLVALMPLRLVYRLFNPPAPLPAHVAGWQRGVSHAVHWLLYGLIIVNAVLGWLATSAYGAPISFFGLFQVPPLMAQDRALYDSVLGPVHAGMGVAIGVLVMAHVGAALMHAIVLKDGVMQRMTGRA